jgi:hypothetical protein
MNNDRELLEMAAKAAGIEYKEYHVLGLYTPRRAASYWNPLTDDGDALRLAVKLGMWVIPKDGWTDVMTKEGDLLPIERHDDPYAATRRAIVRAAAAIGESL